VQAASNGDGAGAEFRVCLPLADPALPAESERQAELAQSGVISGKRLLLIDDDEDTLNTFGDLLKSEDAELVLARSAAEALKQVELQHFDLIISDIAMPGMDGYQFLAALRKKPQTAKVPVVAITGFGRMIDVERALKAGFAAHMQKPIVFDVFARTARVLLNEKVDIG
jgi:two-component system CheB/CheR fusion protein